MCGGCGLGKLKNMNGIAKSTMDDLEEKEIQGIAAAATEDFDDSDDLDQGNQLIVQNSWFRSGL